MPRDPKKATPSKPKTTPKKVTSKRTKTIKKNSSQPPTYKFFKTLSKAIQPNSQADFLVQLFQVSQIAAIITDKKGIIKFTNDHFIQSCNAHSKTLVDKSIQILDRRLQSGKFFKQLLLQFQNGLTTTQVFPFKSCFCNAFGNHAIVTPLLSPSNNVRYFSIIFKDVSGQKRSEKLINYMTNYDALTDLPNRVLFNQRLMKATLAAQQNNHKLAVVLLGLDRFKVINNTLGHNAGDHLIQDVGKRLLENMDAKYTIARMGGDEFLLLFPEINSFQDMSQKAQNILSLFSKSFWFEKQEIFIKASLGISLFPEDGNDHQVLLKNADAALNEAKRSGRNHFKFYTAKLDSTATEKLSIETALRQALEHQELILHYQPQVNFTTGKIIGMEALVRWNHPQKGLIPPDKFIPLAEETGLIVPMGQWILRTACLQLLEWHRQGFSDLRVSVNLSARQFQEPELVEAVLNICKQTDFDPKFLELEITESIFMNDLNITNMILQWFSKKRITIAIDDFGTGYSSLTYLKQLPIHTLKIDKSFVQDCLTNSDDAAIVTTITSIAKNLNMKITAEGVEEEAQLEFLRDLGCHDFQGYFFSKPVPAEDFTVLLRNGKSLYDTRV